MSTRRARRQSKLTELLAFDGQLLETGCGLFEKTLTAVLGVDEVGRGSLVGPVVAAAMVFPPELPEGAVELLADLDDSKAPHFNHARRLELAQRLQQYCFWGIGEASLIEIETLNISRASLLASHRAILDLARRFEACMLESHLVVIDGKMRIPELPYCQIPEIKADGRSAAVAGASVLAKAHRDSMLIALAEAYPQYDWASNAGYPTPAHQRALALHGVTPLHRKTYKIVRQFLEQQTVLSL